MNIFTAIAIISLALSSIFAGLTNLNQSVEIMNLQDRVCNLEHDITCIRLNK